MAEEKITPTAGPGHERLDLEYWIEILWRRKWIFIPLFLALFLPTTIMTLINANSSEGKNFQAKTSIYFPVLDNSSVTYNLSNLALSGGEADALSMGTQALSQISQGLKPTLQDYTLAILDSRTMKDKVIEKFGKRLFVRDGEPGSMVQARERLNKYIVLQNTPYNVIEIVVSSYDPQLCKEVADFYVAEYKNFAKDAVLTAAKSKRIHLEEQKEKIRKNLNDAEYRLASFENNKKVVQVDKELQAEITNYSQIKLYYSMSQSEVERAKEKLDALKEKYKQKTGLAQEGLNTRLLMDDPLISNLSNQLTRMEINLKSELNNKTEEHPDIIKMRKEIEEVRNKIEEHIAGYARQVEQNLNPQILVVEVEYLSLCSQRDSLEKMMSQAEERLQKYPGLQLTYNRLNRDIRINEALLQMLEQEYERARMEEEKESTDVQILDPAVVPDAPLQNIPFALGVNLVFSLVAGITVVFYVEYAYNILNRFRRLKDELKA